MVRFRGGCCHLIHHCRSSPRRTAHNTWSLSSFITHDSGCGVGMARLTELIRLTDSPKTVFESARGLFSGGEQKFTEGGFSLFWRSNAYEASARLRGQMLQKCEMLDSKSSTSRSLAQIALTQSSGMHASKAAGFGALGASSRGQVHVVVMVMLLGFDDLSLSE